MRQLFRNPELIRHLRAEMRPPRMMLAAGLATVICFLISMAHSQFMVNLPQSEPPNVARSLFVWLAVIQGIVLVMWAFSASLQTIASERQMRTYDFVRTTRMTSAELLVGYVFGVPSMAYFTVGVTAIFAIVAGLGARLPLTAMLATYVLVFVFTVFASLFGLLISMLLEKPRAAGSLLIVWFLAWPLSLMGFAAAGSPFPGISSLAIIPSLIPLCDPTTTAPFSARFFGLPVPLFLLTILLYASFGGWIVLALLRNLKKEREEIQLLTRSQALIFTAFVNLIFLGLYDRHVKPTGPSPFPDSSAVILIFVLMNQSLLYIVGLSTLSPAERLKVWYREFKAGKQPYLGEAGLPWPWMVIAGGIAFIGVSFVGLNTQATTTHPWSAGQAALVILLVLVFAVRDVLFLQWCMLTRMKNAVAKGIGLIWLYYFAATIVSSVFLPYPNRTSPSIFLLTPAGAFVPDAAMDNVFGGIALQAVACGVILYLINQRLAQMQMKTAAVAD